MVGYVSDAFFIPILHGFIGLTWRQARLGSARLAAQADQFVFDVTALHRF